MDETEGIGAVITGGLAARAVEPNTGEAGADDGGPCLNCGAERVGAYCHVCGQKGEVHRSLKAFFHDLLHGVFHFEGKIWRTLPMLAWRPGDLTRRYVEGERARFVSPVALFLFSVFLMFAAFSAVGGPGINTNQTNLAEASQDIAAKRVELGARLAVLKADRAKATNTAEIKKIDSKIAAAEGELALFKVAGGDTKADGGPIEDMELQGFGWLDQAFHKAKENPSLLIYKLQSNAYKFSWALIPISVPFVWLLFFWKRQYKAYDHVIFVTYSIAFMSLLAVALSLVDAVGMPSFIVGTAILLIPPLHMYRQVRGAYSLSRAGAIWRTFFLLGFAFMAAGLYFMLLVTMGVVG